MYKEIWNATMDGTEPPCKKLIMLTALLLLPLKVTPTGNMTVGHTPRVISLVCLGFIRQDGTILCVVNGERQYSSDLPQGGLEVLCILTF